MRQRPELIVSGAWYALVREPQGTNARFSSKWQSQCGCRILADFTGPISKKIFFGGILRVADHTDEGLDGDSQNTNDNVLYHSLLGLASGERFGATRPKWDLPGKVR